MAWVLGGRFSFPGCWPASFPRRLLGEVVCGSRSRGPCGVVEGRGRGRELDRGKGAGSGILWPDLWFPEGISLCVSCPRVTVPPPALWLFPPWTTSHLREWWDGAMDLGGQFPFPCCWPASFLRRLQGEPFSVPEVAVLAVWSRGVGGAESWIGGRARGRGSCGRIFGFLPQSVFTFPVLM